MILAEDEEIVRRAIVPSLEAAGLEVLPAENGDAALALAEANAGTIDALFTDAIMPGLPTRELVERFLEHNPGAAVVICSGHLESELLRRGIEEGRYGFLAKPFTGADLVRRLREEIGGERRSQRRVS